MEAKGPIIFMEFFFFVLFLIRHQAETTVKTTFNHNFAYNKEYPSLALARFHLYQTKK